jgi:hypothetical protein
MLTVHIHCVLTMSNSAYLSRCIYTFRMIFPVAGHRVLKRFIETKVPPGTPDAVMAQTGTGKKESMIFGINRDYFPKQH